MSKKISAADAANLISLIEVFDNAIDDIASSEVENADEVARDYIAGLSNMAMALAAISVIRTEGTAEALNDTIDDLKSLNAKMKGDLSGLSAGNARTIILKGGNS